jgi:hypothetical protein
MKQTLAEAAALARENLRLRIENRRLGLHLALQQLEEALIEASLQKKGLLTAWKLWREMRREHHVSMRLLRLGWRLLSQDEAERADARRRWKRGELPGELNAELLARLIHFAPDHAWNQEKLRRVGSGCGLTPDDLLQVLREKQTDGGSSPQA